MNAKDIKLVRISGTKKVIECTIYAAQEPETMPADGGDVDNLDSSYVFDIGSVLIVVSEKKAYIWCGDTDGWVELGGEA